MATRTVSAVGGNWSLATTWAEGVVPTSADDVVNTATSGALTIDSNQACRSFTYGNAKNLTFTGSSVLSVGSASGGALNVSGMGTITKNSGSISFVSTSDNSGAGWGVTTGGVSMPPIAFNGAGGKWSLNDALGSSGAVTLTAGTVVTNGYSITASSVALTSASVFAFDFTNSTITLSATSNPWNYPTTSGGTITATGSTISFTGNVTSVDMSGPSGVAYNAVAFTGTGSTTCTFTATACSFTTLTRSGGGNRAFAFAQSNTIGTFNVSGSAANNREVVRSSANGTTVTLTVGTLNASNVDFRDITAAGAANWNLAAITGNSGDQGGNTGITFTTGVTHTWVGTSGGNWSDSTKFSGGRMPLPQDDVNISTAFAATQTITIDVAFICRNLSFVGTTGSPTLSYTPAVSANFFGSLTLISGMTLSLGIQTVSLLGRGTHTLTSAGQTFTGGVLVGGTGGTYTLGDAVTISRSASGVGLTVTTGATLNTNDYTVTLSGATSRLTCTTPGVLNLGASTVNLQDTAAETIIQSTGTVSGAASTINITAASANERTISTRSGTALGVINYTVAASTGALSFAGPGGTIQRLTVSDASGAKTVKLTAGTSRTINDFNVQGASGRIITVNSGTGGSQGTLLNTGGHFSTDWLSITDIAFGGTGSFYAGANSTNGGNNTDINFANRPSQAFFGAAA